jgi:ParB family transcriptional regulator, chromosome partitioning protein
MQRKKTGLGKGLDALIPGGTSAPSREGVLIVPVEQISPNPRQPRTKFDPSELGELAASIHEHGIIQPLIVTYDSGRDRYILIAGERRLQAARTAGLEQVPVILRDDASEQQYLELALIENVQRTDLNPLEAAEAYRQLTADFNLSHEEIAARVGKSRTAITNTLRLLKLPPSIQQYLVAGDISEGHARALLALPNHQAQTALVEIVIAKDLNVRQTEELVRKYSGQKPTASSRPTPPPEIRSLEDRLRTHLGTRVKLHHGEIGGSITIHYYSDEELNQIISQILGE